MPNITVKSDLSVHVLSDDESREFSLAAYDPETQEPFRSKPEALACARRLMKDSRVWRQVAASKPKMLRRLSPVEFKMAFTISERVEIANIRASEAPEDVQAKQVLDLWYEVLDDPRLTFVDLNLPSIQEGLDFLETIGVLTPGRKETIMATESAA